MLYGNYRFQIRFETEAELPPYKGSTIRGVFGHALKRTVCVLRHQECPACILREKCLYTQVFETALSLPKSAAAPNGAIPHPFVIEPPLETKTSYQPGDTLECGLILFGEVNRMLPYFIHAFEEMGRIGLGRTLSPGRRGNFIVEEVSNSKKRIFEREDGGLLRLDEPEGLDLKSLMQPEPNPSDRPVRIAIETPLRFKQKGCLSDRLPFETLTRLALRRMSSLLETYGEGEPRIDYRGLVFRAASIRTRGCQIRWLDWERYSNRQRRNMQLGGVVGTAEYWGDFSEFIPLLRFAERVHIGKQTSFGLGRISVDPR